MSWSSVRHPKVAVLITPGYLPDRERIDVAAAKYFQECPEDERTLRPDEEATAWLLSSLARRHIGYRYRAWRDVADIEVQTWLLSATRQDRGPLDDWFRLPGADSEQYRLFVHAYPRDQVGRQLMFNVFDYPHKQLGTRRGRYRGLANLKPGVAELLTQWGEAVSKGEAAANAYACELGHPVVGSSGWTTRRRSSLVE